MSESELMDFCCRVQQFAQGLDIRIRSLAEKESAVAQREANVSAKEALIIAKAGEIGRLEGLYFMNVTRNDAERMEVDRQKLLIVEREAEIKKREEAIELRELRLSRKR